jgi:hypothetical protein
MKQLQSLMNKLNTDVYASVTVYDRDTQVYIHRNMTQAKIIDDYGSSEEFFEQLYASGHKRLTLFPKRKNGNSFKVDGESFDVNFGKQTNEKMEKSEQKPAKKKKKKKKNDSFGLGASEIFDLKLSAYEKDRFSRENEILTAKCDRLETENRALVEEKLQKKFTVEKNEALNATILGGIKQIPFIMKGLGMNVPDAALGLQANVTEFEDENLSGVKKGFIQVIKATDDDMVTLMQVIYNKINQNVETNQFAIDLQELLQKHQMIIE